MMEARKVQKVGYSTLIVSLPKDWVEEVLGERLPNADLLEGLKDGVALCKSVTAYLQT